MGKVQTQGLRRVTCRGSVRRDISVLHRGPQEARGKLLPFSCMQEKQLIIRVSSEKDGSRGRPSLMFSRSNSYDHHGGALLSPCLYRSIVGCAAWRTYIRASFFGYTRARVGYKQTQQISYLTVMRGWRPSWDGGCCWPFPRVLWAAADACKTCHRSRKQRLLHNNTLACCPVGSPSETRPVAQSRGSRFGLRNVTFLLMIQPMWKREHLVISYWYSGEKYLCKL